jgi:hypothetical protein
LDWRKNPIQGASGRASALGKVVLDGELPQGVGQAPVRTAADLAAM